LNIEPLLLTGGLEAINDSVKRYGQSYPGISHYGGLIVSDWVKQRIEEEVVAIKKTEAISAVNLRKHPTILTLSPFKKSSLVSPLLNLKPRLPPGARLALIPVPLVASPEDQAARRRSYYMNMTNRCLNKVQIPVPVPAATGGKCHNQGAPLLSIAVTQTHAPVTSSLIISQVVQKIAPGGGPSTSTFTGTKARFSFRAMTGSWCG
jgi:hypothetical protein